MPFFQPKARCALSAFYIFSHRLRFWYFIRKRKKPILWLFWTSTYYFHYIFHLCRGCFCLLSSNSWPFRNCCLARCRENEQLSLCCHASCQPGDSQPYFIYHLQTPLLNIKGLAGPRGEWHSIGWLWPTSRETEKISKDIVNIIGCHRPEAWIDRGWETVVLSIANDIVTIIGCSRPEARIGKGGRQARWAQPITGFLLPPPPTPTSLLLSSGTLYIS